MFWHHYCADYLQWRVCRDKTLFVLDKKSSAITVFILVTLQWVFTILTCLTRYNARSPVIAIDVWRVAKWGQIEGNILLSILTYSGPSVHVTDGCFNDVKLKDRIRTVFCPQGILICHTWDRFCVHYNAPAFCEKVGWALWHDIKDSPRACQLKPLFPSQCMTWRATRSHFSWRLWRSSMCCT